jgi:polyketide synthase PksN
MYGYIVKTDRGVNFTIADYNGEVKVIITDFVGHEFGSQQDQLVYYKPEWQEERTNVNGQDRNNISTIEGQTSYTGLVKSVFATAQKLIRDKTDQHIIEVRLPEDKPSWKGIIALLKTIAIEYPKINYRLITEDKVIKLGYREVDLRTIPAYAWPDNKTILITGGLGGVGKLITQDIAKSSKGCTLILVGSSELNDAKKAFVRDLESFDVKIKYVRCDITRQAEVNALVIQYPKISGVIHGSGVNRDNLISRKTLDEIDQVLAPKVEGLEYLDQATANLKLDYFITLSSIAGTLGNAGQTDYAAANGYMDAYVSARAQQVKRQQRYGKSISINWPLWDSEGMQMDEATKENMLQVLKMQPLPAGKGLTALRQIIASDQEQLIVAFGNRKALSILFEKDNINSKKVQKKAQYIDTSKLIREIARAIRNEVADHLKLQPNQIDDTADWAKFGFDSILLSSFTNKLNTTFNLNLMPTVLFEATNMSLLIQYLAENVPEQMAKKLFLTTEGQPREKTVSTNSKVAPRESDQLKISSFAQSFKRAYKNNVVYREKDIAVVGISCRIAGARNPDEFWQMLEQGRNMVTEIPQNRWDWRAYSGVSKWGSFIDGVDEFDSLFFGISPAEAIYMAPEQRLMMQYVWECLENAGYSSNDLKGTNTGLFVGCGPTSYGYFLDALPVEAYTATGFVPSVGPNRISYLMDWHGPSNPIETACSSALVAVHRAVEAIRAGHCDQAIVGGVNLLLSPDGYISFSKSGMLCEDGKCKTFSDKANGYVRGEGIGMLMLKPLKAAIDDGNMIYALIKGTAENHGGHTNSLTAPNPKSQASVVKKAIIDADVDFSRIGYIECHGTGTPLGDPVEIEGLKMVATDLRRDSDNTQPCKLGSIKSNIGHLEYGAGIVGLIKVILQMKHKKIAKSLHCDKINPYIDLTGTPFQIAQSESDWLVPSGQTRVAGVSSFGFGGVNAHVILEEFQQNVTGQQEEESQDSVDQQLQLLVISARSEESLINYVTQLPNFIKTINKNQATLKRIAFTLQLGRSEMQERLAFAVRSIDEWSEQIDNFLRAKGKIHNRNIYRGTVKANAANSLEIGENQAERNYVMQLLQTNQFEKLGELWVTGTKIDWKILYP